MFALRRALVGTAAAPVRCRAFCSTPPAGGKSPWLADKSMYPLLGITAVTVLVGAWYGPHYLYTSPEKQAPMRRQTTGEFPRKRAYEKGPPFDENLYEKCDELSKAIYAYTVKDKKTVEDEKAGKV